MLGIRALKIQRASLAAEKKQLTKQLKLETRKRQRVMRASRKLNQSDLRELLRLRPLEEDA